MLLNSFVHYPADRCATSLSHEQRARSRNLAIRFGLTLACEHEMSYRSPRTTAGELAEWLRSGLQIRVHRFDSGTRLQ